MRVLVVEDEPYLAETIVTVPGADYRIDTVPIDTGPGTSHEGGNDG